MIEQGSLVFFRCPRQSWTLGTVETWDGNSATCRGKENTQHIVAKLKQEHLFAAKEDMSNDDVDDLLQLTFLHEATLLRCLYIRYMRDVIYTNIGAIAVAFNPFNFKIPEYTDDKMPNYLSEGDRIERNLPHSWAVAHNTYYEMRNDLQNQCILVSGESGAGKTEASKIVMKYLAAVSCLRGTDEQKKAAIDVGEKIKSTSPILEAFGNGKTVRNDNSSRFGKFMKVKFDNGGFLTGAFIIKYLLEKSRIVTAAQGERLYHSFYLAVRGKENGELGVADEKAIRTLGSGGVYNNKEFNSAEEYEHVLTAMKGIGIADEDAADVWKVVAGVLRMGNVDFAPDGEGSTITADTMGHLSHTSKLWKVDEEVLKHELVTTTLSIGGKQITKLLNPTLAMDCRDALVKALYDFTFGWLVERCNMILDKDASGQNTWVGLLDIFGFEDFEVNSFEQVCINLANETLQNHYNNYIFTKDMEECRSEGVNVDNVVFPDNAPCMDLLMGKRGVMGMLDEECTLGQGSDDGFLSKLEQAHGKHPFFVKKKLVKNAFIVRHYAGNVSYTVDGFLEKNRDTLKDSLKVLMRASSSALIQSLLPEPEENAKKITVGGYFKNQLRDLMELINSTNPHWIRCIKPHPAKKPLMFDGVTTMNQLESSGVLGTVKIRKAGYPIRMPFSDFITRYFIVAKASGKASDPKAAGEAETSQIILEAAGISSERVQMGVTRVFLKTEGYLDMEKAKKQALATSANVLIAYARAFDDVACAKEKFAAANKGAMDKYRIWAVRAMDVQREEVVERNALFKKHCERIDHAAEMIIRDNEKMIEDMRRFEEERRRRVEERKAALEAERAEKERIRRERAQADEARRAEENEAKMAVASAQKARREQQQSRILGQVSRLAALSTASEKALQDRIAREYVEAEKKRQKEAERRRLVAERRRHHDAKEQEREALLLDRMTAKQFEADLLKAKGEISRARKVERQKLTTTLRHTHAMVKEQEDRMLDEEWKKRCAENTRVRQELLQAAAEATVRNAKATTHQSFIDREVQRKQRAAATHNLVAKTHTKALKSNEQKKELLEHTRAMANDIQAESRKTVAEVQKEGQHMLEDLKELAEHTRKVLSPPRVQNPMIDTTVDLSELNAIRETPAAETKHIDPQLHRRLMGPDKYSHIIVAKPYIAGDDVITWK